MKQKIDLKIPFNKPTHVGTEKNLVLEAIENESLAGNNDFTKKCHTFFKDSYGFENSFLTHSCSLALEMAASLCNLKPTDEVIVPSYAYVTDASSFIKVETKVVFADSRSESPHISYISIREKITSKTKVLLIVHYAGVSCDMEEILKIVKEFNLILIEDCAQAIHAKYKDTYLGTFGHMSTFSFHETKNIQCGEGGLLVINDSKLLDQAIQIWNEGTNKNHFIKGEVSSYEWTTIGSSYQPSELTASFLYSQLKKVNVISDKRKIKWTFYQRNLKRFEIENKIELPVINDESYNAHIFYIKLKNKNEREKLQLFLRGNDIETTFHFLPLHKSRYWLTFNENETLKNAENWFDCLLRLPLYDSINEEDQKRVIKLITAFFNDTE